MGISEEVSVAGPRKRLECEGGIRRKAMKHSSMSHVGEGIFLITAFLLGLAAQILISTCALAQSTQAQAAGIQQPQLMDREKEIALALSACPSFAASKAAVYVLDKSGYVKVRESQNGFTAIVQHSQPAA